MAYLGLILFVLTFVLIAPQSQAFLLGLAIGAGAWVTAWSPFSYILLLLMATASFAGVYIIRTWPVRVDEGNPMAKYRHDIVDDDD